VAFITSANAKELGSLGGKTPRKQKPPIVQTVLINAPDHDTYSRQTLLRVRKQVKSVLGMLEAETDPQKIDRLASALARLSEIERQLANRPLPGSWKPERPARAKQAWVDPTPAPIPQPVVEQPKPEQPKPGPA